MAAGSADDVNLFFGVMEFTADVAAWTPAQLLMTASGSTGTANSMSIIAVYSQAGVFDANTPNAGTTLWLDGFVLGATALGLDEEAALTAKVYPNPTSTVLNVNTSSAVTTVSILSLDGKVLSTTNMNGTSTSVDVSTLTSGVYFYEIVAEDGNVIRDTFVKK